MKYMSAVNKSSKICFIDSNIWLYAFIQSQDAEKSTLAKSLLKNSKISIVISTQVINEVCINLMRKARFSEEGVHALIEDFYSKYGVFEIYKETLLKASKIRQHYNFSFWDSLVVASALNAEAEFLYSEDMQHGSVVEKVRVVNPFKDEALI